jgi:site-specific recombinase XerD
MQMRKEYQISYFLDTRRAKKNSLYPVKLRIYATLLRKQKLYPTIFEFSEKEFKETWLSKKPREHVKENRLKLSKFEIKANSTAEKINPFSFEIFEKKLGLSKGEGQNVIYHYNELIKYYTKLNRIGTKDNYSYSLKSIIEFYNHLNNLAKDNEPEKILFIEITKNWLEQYEQFIIKVKEQSKTTIGFYLRPLRAVFNRAIQETDISKDIYPFTKDKYKIPKPKKVKKALNSEQLKLLFDAKPKTPEQEKAKDFWFFSYSCNGMNVKDITQLKKEDIKTDSLVYYRAKTINTSKDNLTPIVIYLNEYSRSIIDKYSKKNISNKDFIFDIISENDNEQEKQRKIKNFVRFINQNLKKLAIANDLPNDISTYWARHSFTTIAVRNGASLEFISEALNHSDLKTTKNYMAGFEDEVKKEFSNNLMKF